MIRVNFKLKEECRVDGRYQCTYLGKPLTLIGPNRNVQFEAETMDEAIAAVDLNQVEEFHLIPRPEINNPVRLLEAKILEFRNKLQGETALDLIRREYDNHFCITNENQLISL